MSYNLLGYNFMTTGGYDPYGMNMANSLYMMNFYKQLKNYYAQSASGTAGSAGNTAVTGSGTENVASTDFQTAFQEAFRKALQESMGITGSTTAASQTVSGTDRTTAGTVSHSTVSARNAYQTMSSYCSHPSHVWTSSFAQ